VETSLPSKKEILLYAQMTPIQKKLDKQLREKTLQVRARMRAPRAPFCISYARAAPPRHAPFSACARSGLGRDICVPVRHKARPTTPCPALERGLCGQNS